MPSSVISAMYYDAARQILTIVYRARRGVYRYYDVTPDEYEEFRHAPSKGTYLNTVFKARQHPYEQVSSDHGIHLVDQSARPHGEGNHGENDHKESHRREP